MPARALGWRVIAWADWIRYSDNTSPFVEAEMIPKIDKPEVKKTGRIGSGIAGPGRPKGIQNKATRQIKDMIIAALDQAGGAEYLARQAEENPGPFMTLIGKVLPMQLTGEGGDALKIEMVRRVVLDGDSDD